MPFVLLLLTEPFVPHSFYPAETLPEKLHIQRNPARDRLLQPNRAMQDAMLQSLAVWFQRRVSRKARHVTLFLLWLSLKNAFHARRPWKMLEGQFKKWCGCHEKLHSNVTKATKSVTWMSPDIARPRIQFHSNTGDTKSGTPGCLFVLWLFLSASSSVTLSLSLSLLLVCECSYFFFSRLLFAFEVSWCLSSPQLGSFSTKLPQILELKFKLSLYST